MTKADEIAPWASEAAEAIWDAILGPAGRRPISINLEIISAALEYHYDRGFNAAKEEAWQPINEAAKSGTKVELVIQDIYSHPPKHNITIGYFDNGRWWGSGISSHWSPVLYRPINEAKIAIAIAGMKEQDDDGSVERQSSTHDGRRTQSDAG